MVPPLTTPAVRVVGFAPGDNKVLCTKQASRYERCRNSGHALAKSGLVGAPLWESIRPRGMLAAKHKEWH